MEVGTIAGYKTPDIYHFDDFGIQGFGEHAPGGRDVVHYLVEACPLDLLALEVGDRIHEVEDDAALLEFADEKILLFRSRSVCGRKRWIQNGKYKERYCRMSFPIRCRRILGLGFQLSAFKLPINYF